MKTFYVLPSRRKSKIMFSSPLIHPLCVHYCDKKSIRSGEGDETVKKCRIIEYSSSSNNNIFWDFNEFQVSLTLSAFLIDTRISLSSNFSLFSVIKLTKFPPSASAVTCNVCALLLWAISSCFFLVYYLQCCCTFLNGSEEKSRTQK